MEVGAAEAEGADPSPPDARLGPHPVAQLRVDPEGATGEINVRVGPGEVEAGGQHLVVDRHDHLEDAGGASACLEVTDVRLHRAQGDRAGGHATSAEDRRHALVLHHISDTRGRAVTLDQGGRLGRHARVAPGPLHAELLANRVGRGDPLSLPIARSGHPEQHAVDAIAVVDRVTQPFEHERGRPLAHHETVGTLGVGTSPRGRQGADLAELHVGGRAHVPIDAAGDHSVVFALDEPAHS